MTVPYQYEPTLERMFMAVERVRLRMEKAVAALEAGGVLYAVIGGNAVASWVARVDEGAVRNTRDVDILIRRDDLPAAIAAMAAVGFIHAEVSGVDLFIDGPNGKPSEGVHLLFAGEKVKPTDPVPTPSIDEAERATAFRVVSLEALLRMKLVANRDKDRTHIRDLIGVGLVDHTWPDRYPDVLAERLRRVLADPDG